MKLFIVHHHLNPGGVTRIIQSQVNSLRQHHPESEIVILTGKSGYPEFFSDLNIPVEVNSGLDYILGRDLTNREMTDLKNEISGFLESRISKDDIIHAHNLNLGKNPLLTLAVSEMAKSGFRVFNHCHDFAEDRRPNMDALQKIIHQDFGENTQAVMYPNLSNYLFGTINAFDRERILKKGIPGDRVIHLPNPVHFKQKSRISKQEARPKICEALKLDADKSIITYPVRVIQRKNIGELILLSTIFEGKANWLVTQPPKNPEEIKHYDAWKKFCAEEEIAVTWEAGTSVDFEELLIATDVCISTSIREGFGMVFLEPWLLGTPVMGRNISYVTKDLTESGVEFPLLYDEINVEFEDAIHDFGDLDPGQQQNLIHKIRRDNSEKKKIRDMNPQLKILFEKVAEAKIEHNKATIKKEYSLENYASRLNGIYRKMA
jgi:glycosyltransferase involved in cell wall biosynthesis